MYGHGSLQPGDRVFNLSRGFGTIVEEWGSWQACRYCFAPYGGKNQARCRCVGDDPTDYMGRFRLVSGAGVYDVKFDDPQVGTVAIDQLWLTLMGATEQLGTMEAVGV
jgi:hypothetical protein